jgi:hypothetical protein
LPSSDSQEIDDFSWEREDRWITLFGGAVRVPWLGERQWADKRRWFLRETVPGRHPVVVSGIPAGDAAGLDAPCVESPGLVVEVDIPGRIEATLTGPTWLVVRDWFIPGWEATLDKAKPLSVYRADGGLMAMHIPAGLHRVELQYRVPGLRVGCLVAVAGLVICGVVVIAVLVRRTPANGSARVRVDTAGALDSAGDGRPSEL